MEIGAESQASSGSLRLVPGPPAVALRSRLIRIKNHEQVAMVALEIYKPPDKTQQEPRARHVVFQ
jgi:hypothetical protein